MSDTLRPLRVNVLELLRQPGTLRAVTATIGGEPLDIVHDALVGEVEIDVELEATTDGVNVRGKVVAPWSGRCRRCLTGVSGHAVVDVAERYQPELTDDDAYEIENNQLDLAPMARQLVLLELDDERLCRPDCVGLCPMCGTDRNEGSCSCDTTVRDERWAALDGLVLDD